MISYEECWRRLETWYPHLWTVAYRIAPSSNDVEDAFNELCLECVENLARWHDDEKAAFSTSLFTVLKIHEARCWKRLRGLNHKGKGVKLTTTNDGTLFGALATSDASPDGRLDLDEMRRWLFPEQNQLLDLLLSGLVEADCARALGISRERVRQLKEKAFERIRRFYEWHYV